jgi:hypothetical protein
MSRMDCFLERFSNWGVGAIFLLVGLGFFVIGLTILPVIGFFIAIPVAALGLAFLFAERSKECLI